MFHSVRGIVFVAAVTATSGASLADDIGSANVVMPGCRAMAMEAYEANTMFRGGVCFGVVTTLRFTGPAIALCIPDSVTNGQMVRVVAQYIDARPARLHENFKSLAVEALQAAWPCKK